MKKYSAKNPNPLPPLESKADLEEAESPDWLIDGIDEGTPPQPDKRANTLVEMFDRIVTFTRNDLYGSSADQLKQEYSDIEERLGLCPIQAAIVGVLAENGGAMSWRQIGEHFGESRLHMMTYTPEVEDLIEKGWLDQAPSHEGWGKVHEGFSLAHGVVTAIRKNDVFKPETLSGMTLQTMTDRISAKLEVGTMGFGEDFHRILSWTLRVVRSNPQHKLCQEVQKIDGDWDRFLLMCFVADHANWDGSPEEGLSISRIDTLYPTDNETDNICDALRHGYHDLQQRGIIEPRCIHGMADQECFVLTRRFIDDCLTGYEPNRSQCEKTMPKFSLLTSWKTVKERVLFFNPEEERQLERLADLLKGDRLAEVQRRLEEEGLRKGLACIFHGAPGTGKTESVLQLARMSERDIMRIDIAHVKSKWVGESEKSIRNVFARYREFCEGMERIPILFFNEADAIFNRRNENAESSVDKMNNAMQNIILEELENLPGILIATTNLTGNLDRAFERRFLFKVQFEKPQGKVKRRIWKSMMGRKLEAEGLETLARRYDFSGGQIENIARKCSIDYALTGRDTPFAEILRYCDQESLGSGRQKVGF